MVSRKLAVFIILKQKRRNKMRDFKNQIMMGNAQPTSTEAKILDLHKKLEEALDALSVVQQNYESKTIEEAEFFIKDIVRDIAMALTGFDILFKKARKSQRRRKIEEEEEDETYEEDYYNSGKLQISDI